VPPLADAYNAALPAQPFGSAPRNDVCRLRFGHLPAVQPGR